MPSQRDQRLVQSEKAIIEAGIKTFLSNPAAGMSEIAQVSGVGRTTLYRHFDSKETLIQAIALRCLEEINEVLQPVQKLRGRKAIEATFVLLMPVANRYRFLSTLWPEVINDPLVVQLVEQSARDMEWLFKQAKDAGEIDRALPNVWLTNFYDMTLITAWSLLESGDINTEKAVRFATQSFFQGCGK